MKYTIVSIDESRAGKKAGIRERVDLEEVTDIDFCDARKMDEFLEAHPQHRIPEHQWPHMRGERAIWFSNLSVWEWVANNGPLLVLEDDAILSDDFMVRFSEMMEDVPSGWDFVSFWVPPQQKSWYAEEHYLGSERVARIYQNYSFVTTLYSQAGAEKVLSLAHDIGMRTTADCFMIQQAHAGKLNGYAPLPEYPSFVFHDNVAPSLKGR